MGLVSRIYKKMAIHRYDGESYLKYFSAADFPGLEAVPAEFDSDGNKLRGFFYGYPGSREDALIVFCHGIGGGHLSYTREIETICRAGYRVFAYDNTGCCSSEGDDIGSMSRSLADLDSALNWLKEEGTAERYGAVYTVGHSWGAFAAGCIPLYHDEIKKTVVISGFLSVGSLLESQTAGMKIPFKKALVRALLRYEAKADPAHQAASVTAAVGKGSCSYLIAHSKDDAVVPYESSAALLKERFPEQHYIILDGRKHNPNYTDDAVGYMNSTFSEFAELVNEKKLTGEREKKEWFAKADWMRMTEQDPEFWQTVFSFLNN